MVKKLIKSLLTLTFMLCMHECLAQGDIAKNRWENLIKAISEVESSGNERAVSGKHVGILQISPILVDDCNRICKKKENGKKYTYNDRYSKKKSIEMFNIIQDFYNPTHDREKAMRIWNGGCKYSIKATNGYVKKVLEKLRLIEKATK